MAKGNDLDPNSTKLLNNRNGNGHRSRLSLQKQEYLRVTRSVAANKASGLDLHIAKRINEIAAATYELVESFRGHLLVGRGLR
ncbi:hypothetical protein BaRGS_00037547, partial [Batillaria attramentaria]